MGLRYIVLAVACAVHAWPQSSGLAWPGCADLTAADFRKVKVGVANASSPTKMAFAPDGRLFLISLDGQIWSWQAASGTTTAVASLPVYRSGVAFGLVGIALEPDFRARPFIYLLYSAAPPVSAAAGIPVQLWRYPYLPATGKLDLAGGRKLLEFMATRAGREDHSGGGMAFDAQGNLYVSTGDNAGSEQNFGNIDETKADYNSLRSAGNANDLRGKILRIRPRADGGYDIPEGNLFPPGTAGTRPEIYAMGNRNPYTLHVDKPTGLLLWGDVGPQAGAFSATKGPAGMDEFNATRSAGNFGWPMFIGPNLAYNDFDYAADRTGPLFDSLAPVNKSALNTGIRNLPRARGSVIAYGKDGLHNPWLGFARGSAISIAGPLYRYDGKSPSRVKLPPHFEGKWLIADTYQRWIKAVTLDASGEKATAVTPVFTGLTFGGGGSIATLDLQVAPDGALHVLEYASKTVSRIEYTGSCLPDVTPSRLSLAQGPTRLPGPAYLLSPPPGADWRIEVGPGRPGFSLYDTRGRRVWRHRRTAAGAGETVIVPVAAAGRSLLRLAWDK